MIKLDTEVKIMIDQGAESAIFCLRRPSNDELLKYMELLLYLQHWGQYQRMINARCALFDSLLLSVEGLLNTDGEMISPAQKDMIPPHWKNYAICKCVEEANLSIKSSVADAAAPIHQAPLFTILKKRKKVSYVERMLSYQSNYNRK